MSAIDEIKILEGRLVEAELVPDAESFSQILSDDAILDGERAKTKIVAAHQPGKGPKFTKVEMSGFQFVDHGHAVVVTCKGAYEGPQWSGSLSFMRVWLRTKNGWQIIAGSTK